MCKCASVQRKLAVVVVIAGLILSMKPLPVRATSLRYEMTDVYTADSMISSDQYANLLILDVRSAGEFKLGHLLDAISMPFDQLESRINDIDRYKDAEVIVYCRFGFTSQRAAEVLLIHGFTRVFNMIGGISAWLEADLPIWIYVGSATGTGSTNLENRIRRHFTDEKAVHWHIDYLLKTSAIPLRAIWTESNRSAECDLAREMNKSPLFVAGPRGFGASDCTGGCGTHLFRFTGFDKPEGSIQEILSNLGLTPFITEKDTRPKRTTIKHT